MTKKEVVSSLRRKFNKWCALLPDVEFKTYNDNSEIFTKEGNVNTLHILELGAEEEKGGEK